MSMRAVFLLFVTALLGVITAINWQVFTAPTTLSLMFGSVQAPLGVVMLVVVGLIAIAFVLYIAYLQATLFAAARRYAREVQTHKKLADDAEASRLTDLHVTLEAALRQLEENVIQSRADVQARLDQLATEMRATVEQTGTVLTAYLGEIEDRLERRIASIMLAPAP